MDKNLKNLMIADCLESVFQRIIGGIASTASAILFGGFDPRTIALANIMTRSFGIFAAIFMAIDTKVSYRASRVIGIINIVWLVIPFPVTDEIFAIVALILLLTSEYIYWSFDTSVSLRITKMNSDEFNKKYKGNLKSATSLIGIVAVVISAILVEEYGWRLPYTIVGILQFAIIFINAWMKVSMEKIGEVVE